MFRSRYIFLILGVFFPCYAKRPMFYRKDYTYVERYDAFYKMHWDSNVYSWNSAFKVCDFEGAQLFYPKLQDEWTVAKELQDNLVEQPNVTDIFIGLHDEFNIGEFITTDGHSTESPLNLGKSISTHTSCVVMDIGSGNFAIDTCYAGKPFICKKVEDVSCPTVDHEYKYVKQLNKCYKVHSKEVNWNDAMQTCYMESGTLAVLETDADLNAIAPLVYTNTFYYIGFRKMFNIDDFYTVKGKIYSGSREWYSRQDIDSRQNCGAVIFTNNDKKPYPNVLDCLANVAQFICEMDSK